MEGLITFTNINGRNTVYRKAHHKRTPSKKMGTSVFYLEKILELRAKYSTTYQRIWFDTPLLYTPDWQSIQLLPKAYEQCIWDCINFMNDNLDEMHGFKDYEVLKMRRDLQFMQKGTDDVERKKADFYRFFTEHDKRRGTNFEETFPEMKGFWNECRHFLR